MGNGGKALQTLGVIVCVGGLVWAGFALGRVKGKREGRSEVEARWAHARSVAEADRAAAAAPSALGQALAALEGCADTGESPMAAPHFCSTGTGTVAITAAHWWGDSAKPNRVYMAFGPGSGASDAPLQALLTLRLRAMELTRRFEGSPVGFWESGDLDRQYRSGDYTVAVREYRNAPTDASLMITVDITARD